MVIRVLIAAVMALCLLGCQESVQPSADSISAASKNHYEESALTGDALLDTIRERTCSFTLATVNADGTPNTAVIIPGVADPSHLMFRMAPNQSKTNILERKLAVLTAYIHDPEAEEKLERHKGARLVLELVDDDVALMEATDAGEGMVFMKIVRVMPLG